MLVSANRRRTVVVLTVSAALLLAALGWAAAVGRGRPSPAELAAKEFYAAVFRGDCDVADALLTESGRAQVSGGRDGSCADRGGGTGDRVVGARARATGHGWAIVLVETELAGQVSWLPLGLRYEDDGGRWQVARIGPDCRVPADWQPPTRCRRWDWP
jgi:hypothetical protein